MGVFTQPSHTDLSFPIAPDPSAHPDEVHTNYFGLTIPEEAIGCYFYLRGQPGLGVSHGGVVVFQGLESTTELDALFHDYRISMPWPTVDGSSITADNGLRIEWLEAGERGRLGYVSPDGATSIDVDVRAVSPLFGRGHIVPGEEDHHGSDAPNQPGGSEQLMHVTGTLVVRGDRFAVDCFHVRDRSWSQIRGEDPSGAKPTPPYGWTPMYFGPDLAFSAASFESPDTKPRWTGICEPPAGLQSVGHGWIVRNGEARAVVDIKRDVLEYHPLHLSAVKQVLDVEDSAGERYRFRGEAIAVSPMPAWPNLAFRDGVYKWTTDDGRSTHCAYQEMFSDTYIRGVRKR